MEYILQNSTEIMQLLLGSSALIFSVSVARTLSKLNYILGKVSAWVKFFDEHLQVPFDFIRSVYRFLERL